MNFDIIFSKITRLGGQAKTKLELFSIMWHNMPLCWYFGLSKHFFIPSTTSKHFRRLMPRCHDERMSSRCDRISKSKETCYFKKKYLQNDRILTLQAFLLLNKYRFSYFQAGFRNSKLPKFYPKFLYSGRSK